MHKNGPMPVTREARLELCREFASRLHQVYGERLLAVGVYGSVSRGTDGPYSDIEMMGVLRESEEPINVCHEWAAGPWKAEVDILRADLLLEKAATVHGRWPLTHGPYFAQLSLYDPEGFFPKLRETAASPARDQFRRVIREVLAGEMFEFAGKVRNVHLAGPRTYLPVLAVDMARYGAMLIGLHNRALYTTGAMVLPEALELPGRPDGFDRLARMVMAGALVEPDPIVAAVDAYWDGLERWAAEQEYDLYTAGIPF